MVGYIRVDFPGASFFPFPGGFINNTDSEKIKYIFKGYIFAVNLFPDGKNGFWSANYPVFVAKVVKNLLKFFDEFVYILRT